MKGRREPQWCSRDFPGTMEAAADAEMWLTTQSSALGLPSDAKFAINLCVEELITNAVKHGRANRATISIWNDAAGVRLEFIDDGAPFDPTVAPAKRISGPNEDYEIGGFGTGLIQKFSRRISYRRADGRNRLMLEFDGERQADTGPGPTA